MNKKYNIIYADPPWNYNSKSYQDNNRNMLKLEDRYYQTMGIEELKKLNVNSLTNKDAICFLWVTDSHLKDGIEVLESWGFKYKTVAFNWIKKYPSGNFCVNFAPWTLKSWELCLLGTKGNMSKYKKTNSLKGLVFAVRTKHSKKPDIFAKKIQFLFGDIAKIELFARDNKEGWDVWGNEINSNINIKNKKEIKSLFKQRLLKIFSEKSFLKS